MEKKNHEQLKNTLIYKAKQFMLTEKFKKNLHFLQEGANGVQVGVIEQVTD